MDDLMMKVMLISGFTCGLGFLFGMIFQGILSSNRREEELGDAYDTGYEHAVDQAIVAERDCGFPGCPVLHHLNEEASQRARERRHDAFRRRGEEAA